VNWSNFADFLAMGGYGLYVWGSFAMVGAALVWEALMLAHRRASALDNLRERAVLRGPAP
jgi:heme exporter protein D